MAADPRSVAQWIAAYAAGQTDRMPASLRRETLILAIGELRTLADDPARSPSAFMRAVAALVPREAAHSRTVTTAVNRDELLRQARELDAPHRPTPVAPAPIETVARAKSDTR